MKVFWNFPHELPEEHEFVVVTLGVFDGVHRGHQQILERALGAAHGAPVALVTFDPHPRAVLGPPKRARLLSPIEERVALLSTWPLAGVAVLRFDQTIARMSYVDFVQQMLLDGLGARTLVLGYNVRLGADRQGDRRTLAELGKRLGFETLFVDSVLADGEPVSSTRIRDALDAGDVERARALLGRPYVLEGTIVRGSGRGRALGIPTANLELRSDKLIPGNGVYAARVDIGGTQHAGAVNIGQAPTLRSDGVRLVEVHLLDYMGDLYGARLRLELIRRLRDEQRFNGPQALVDQVRRDVEAVRGALSDPRA